MSTSKAPVELPFGVFYGWAIVAVGWSANFVTCTMNPVVFSVFIDPMRDDLGLKLSDMAWAISARMLATGVISPFLGGIIDRYGTRWLGLFGGLLSGAVMIALYFADNIWVIYLLFAISGISGFGSFGGQLLTIVPVANWFVIKRGRATAIAATGMGVGTTMGVPIALLLINTVGWRLAWVIFGFAIWLVVIPGYGIFMRRKPEDLGMLPDGESVSESNVEFFRPEESNEVTEERMEENWTLGQAVRTPVLWFILLALTVHTFSTAGVLFLRVPFWNDIGISAGAIAFGVALDPFTVIFTMLIFGFLAERYPIRMIGAFGGLWRAISMAPLVLMGNHTAQVFIHNITWGIGSGAFGTAQNLIIPAYYGRSAQGAIRGISLPIMIMAGALGAPVAAYMVDAGMGLGIIWNSSLAMMFVAGLMFLFLKPPKPKPNQEIKKDL